VIAIWARQYNDEFLGQIRGHAPPTPIVGDIVGNDSSIMADDWPRTAIFRGFFAEAFKLARALAEEIPVQLAVKSKAEQGYALVAQGGAHRHQGDPGCAGSRLEQASRLSGHWQGVPAPPRRQPARHAKRRSGRLAPDARRAAPHARRNLTVFRHAR
jgi:hypothetical protein